LAIGVLIGVVAISVGGAALLTVYLNRIGDAAEGLQRVDGLGAYEGRPQPVVVDGVSAVNYLLMTTDERGGLEAVVIAHLSSSRRDLTLIALPSDLLADDGVGRFTLATSYAADPLRTARAVENLTAARMDHQVQLGLDGFSNVIDALGGVDLGDGLISGSQVAAKLASAPDRLTRSLWTARLVKAALARTNMGVSITDPNRFDKMMSALTPCITVDSQLTGDEIRSTMVESRVRSDQVEAWPLASTMVRAGTEPDPSRLAALRSALATDGFDDAPAPMAPQSGRVTPGTSIAGGATSPLPSGTPTSSPARGDSSTPSSPKVESGSPTATR
jgi:hypothetical protein